MELNDLEKIRYEKIMALKGMGVEPYPTRANPTHSAQQAIQAFEAAEAAAAEGTTPVVTVTLAGRLRSIRIMGKITFAHIEDGSGRVQLFMRVNDVGEEGMKLFADYYDLGDFIEARARCSAPAPAKSRSRC